MKSLLSKSLLSYVLSIFLLVFITGCLLSQIVDNYIFLISILIMEFIVMVIILLHIFENYIKPIQVATKTITKLVDGNYWSRFHYKSNGMSAVLGNEINKLARDLNQLSTQQDMKTEQLSTVIENTECGLVLIDEKGYIHLVNRTFISMFDKTHQDYIGSLYYDVLDDEEIHQTIQHTFLYERKIKETFSTVHGHYLEIVGAPIFNEKGHLNGSVLVLYDITEFKKLESIRKDFVANVSHELKTPITSIRGFAETLEEGAMNEEVLRKEFIKIIHGESKRLQLLIEDLLTLSRLENDEFKLMRTPVSMKELLNEIGLMGEQIATEKGINYIVKAEEDITLLADHDKLKQVLINLLANAVHYTPQHGVVTLDMDKIDDQLRIRIKDTGIGIDEQDLPRIFERFYRIDKARSRNTGGTGLGLAITKHIVEVHDGQILVESELDVGTTFTILLPIHT